MFSRICARFITVVAAFMLCLLPAAADARSQTMIVTIVNRADKPVAGAKVDILDMQGNKLGSGRTGADGTVRIDIEAPADGRVMIDTNAKGSDGLSAYNLYDLTGAGPDGYRARMSTETSRAHSAFVLDLIKAAVAKCDKADYDRWVQRLDDRIATLEEKLSATQQDADDYARDHNLRVTDLKGAQEDYRRAEKAQAKLDPSLRNPAALDDLLGYISQLVQVDQIRALLAEARQARESVPPFPEDCKKDKKVGLLPGQKTCPDGSGGLLAGALNDLFDSDIDPACEDGSQRRDTERPKKKKHDRHEQHRD